MTERFTGKVALVTGGGSGIGQATEAVAAAVLWLASPESEFVVGHELTVDGAATA
jgi:NAD(P)-dependent dehydrogenase (short-subunit alcohol dehydrogenase family)